MGLVFVEWLIGNARDPVPIKHVAFLYYNTAVAKTIVCVSVFIVAARAHYFARKLDDAVFVLAGGARAALLEKPLDGARSKSRSRHTNTTFLAIG